jgi:citrate lyase subunit gamma (acyl carrier protein)
MKLLKEAVAGTLESSDIMVTVTPAADIKIELESNVEKQFGAAIKATTLAVVKKMAVDGADIRLVDHGALDCTIRARVETALERALQNPEVAR